jgi:hypothetical protein
MQKLLKYISSMCLMAMMLCEKGMIIVKTKNTFSIPLNIKHVA